MATLTKQILRMRLLKITRSHLCRRYLCRDREYRNSVSMTVEETINQMQIARTTTAGTYRNCACQVSFRTRCEGSYLFMSYVHPLDATGS